jgi:hypothetical protein
MALAREAMELTDLKRRCQEQLEAGVSTINLVLPSGVRLCGRYGPTGHFICQNANGRNVVRFKVQAVLNFINRQDTERT